MKNKDVNYCTINIVVLSAKETDDNDSCSVLANQLTDASLPGSGGCTPAPYWGKQSSVSVSVRGRKAAYNLCKGLITKHYGEISIRYQLSNDKAKPYLKIDTTVVAS